MLYFLTSCMVLVCSFILFRLVAGSLAINKPNMISYIFYYDIVLQTFVAAVLTVLFLDNHYVISRVSDDARFYGWLAVIYLLIAMPIGMLFSRLLFKGEAPVNLLFDSYTSKDIDINGIYGKPLKYSIWLFTVISMLACLYTFLKIGYFPFIKVLTATSETVAQLRITSGRLFPGNIYVKNILAASLMPLLSYVWLFYSIKTKALLDRLVALISVLFAVSILYYDFSKAPLLWYVLSFVFVYFYAYGKLSLRLLLFLVGIVFTLLVVMYALKGIGVHQFLSYNTGPVGRIILGQAAGLYMMLDIFPVQHEFIGFSSLSRFMSGVLDSDYTDRAARITMAHFNPKGVEEGTAGVMNSIFIAEAWANLGLLGVLVSPLWVGFLVQTFYLFFLRSRKTPLHLALFVSCSFGGSITGGFNDYIYNGGMLISLFIFSCIFVFAYLLKGAAAGVGKNA